MNSQRGFSFLEIIISVMILLILFSLLLINYNPVAQQASARDKKRLSDLSTLDRAINEFVLDNGFFPDSNNTLRISTILPVGGNYLNSASSGWIQADFSLVASYLPTDPINNDEYFYKYMHNNSSYEINAIMESEQSYAEDDGGNNDQLYEIGNNLELMD